MVLVARFFHAGNNVVIPTHISIIARCAHFETKEIIHAFIAVFSRENIA